MPFDVAVREGVMTLTLDTPGSPINVFNHATAQQLIDILSNVTAADTRAIVFETAKHNSFINGVGLLLAHASQTFDDIRRAAGPPWTAYRMVREAPVPTIAVVRGNCFGCGVEFVLNCDYRIAADTCETRFYMTELNDYLFMPLFGSTWNLPEAVGLGDAVDLLLWGERWDAAKACSRGLVDAVAGDDELARRREEFVRAVLDGAQASRRRGPAAWGAQEDRVVKEAQRRIAELPPMYHEVYTEALRLLESGARRSATYVAHQDEELRCSAATALSPIGKSAYAFFYLRQMAGERAAGRSRGAAEPVAFRVAGAAGGDARRLADDLRGRRLPGAIFVDAGEAGFRLVDAVAAQPSDAGSPPSEDVGVSLTIRRGPAAATEMHVPAYRQGGRLVELARRDETDDREARARRTLLARTLQRFGFEVALTAPEDTFVSTRLLAAYVTPLARYVELHRDVRKVNAELRMAGFVKRPHALLDGLTEAERTVLAESIAARAGCAPAAARGALLDLAGNDAYADSGEPLLLDAVCVSLLDAASAVRAAKQVRDTSIVDLIARERIDFPRHLCSLCTWLKKARVAAALERDRRIVALVGEAAMASARAFVAEGREFYR